MQLTCGCSVACEPDGIRLFYDCDGELGFCLFDRWVNEHLRCKICGKCVNCFPSHSRCNDPFVVDGDMDAR